MPKWCGVTRQPVGLPGCFYAWQKDGLKPYRFVKPRSNWVMPLTVGMTISGANGSEQEPVRGQNRLCTLSE
jgi:hypothetical protein